MGDKFGLYMTLSILELLITTGGGVGLMAILNSRMHMGISVTSVIFGILLLIAPILALSCLIGTIRAHKEIAQDYTRGIRRYEGVRRRLIIVLVLIIVWVVALGYIGWLWYTHSLPPQMSGLYDLLG